MDMQSKKEYLYAEVLVDSELLEKFPEERSAYYQTRHEKDKKEFSRRFIAKLNWHIRNSLSDRQREVIELIIEGFTEREIAARLEIAQQVVNIYKWRAIKRLRKKIKA
jgi:DNA-binding NarL/FixJ family response regulator